MNSPASVEQFINALLPLIFKHRMNDSSIKDQLKLFKSTLPSPNNCPQCVNAVNDYFLKDREEYIKRFYFCKTCQNIVTDKECNICRSENIYFLILDVVYQIYSIINRPSIREKILEIKNRKIFKDTFSSFLDGSIYQDNILITTNFFILL